MIIAVWPKLFRTLYHDNMMEQILILEKTHKFSLHKCNSKWVSPANPLTRWQTDCLQCIIFTCVIGRDEPVTLVDIFPRWLSQVAFTPGGLVMKHALDVAIMLDIVAHNERLNMKELIPVTYLLLYFVPTYTHYWRCGTRQKTTPSWRQWNLLSQSQIWNQHPWTW